MKALVDADVLIYTSAFAAQKSQYHCSYNGVTRTFDNAKPAGTEGSWKSWAKDNNIPKEDIVVRPEVNVLPLATCLMIANQRLQQILTAAGATSHELYASGQHNFRDTVAVTKPYKGNRVQQKPVYFGEVFDFYLNAGTQVVDGMEADDMLGIRQVECEREGTRSCICSIDKDLWQIPGRHYNWNQDEGFQKFRVTPEKGHYWFMVQTLAGDSTDNVPGLPGIGPEKAKAYLADLPDLSTMWATVQSVYHTDNSAYLTEQASLVWVLRERGQKWSIPMYDAIINGKTETHGKGN